MSDAATAEPLGFDPVALRAKYRAERDKRLRADGNAQYVEISGEHAHYLEDPYIDEKLTRAPKTDTVDVVVIGGGFGGLMAGARLREAGAGTIRIIEKGGDFGGTWYWNRYPGAACDVESYIYLPLLEETGFMPVEKYTRAPEILRHCRTIGERFDLYKEALFQTIVTEMRWDEESSCWIVSTDRGDAMKARYVVMANGPLHVPKLPGIPGVQSFKGHTFHTSRWDYEYTGGNSYGGLTGLADKRVGIIGTGATAVQCVPYLGEYAKELFVFQRTPSSIDVRNNRPTDPDWAASLQPGWQRARMANFATLTSGGFEKEDLVGDGWTEIIRNIMLLGRSGFKDAGELMQMADFKKMEQIRGRVDAVVAKPEVAEALKPWYNQFCKRPCFHDEYLATFNRPNVTLVDTEGKGVDRITEKGIVANGVEYELDCIVFATGFEVGTDLARRNGHEVIGRGGQTLSGKWKNGVSSLHGLTTRGFPNLFLIQNAQSGFGVNFPHMIDEQVSHAAWIIRQCTEQQARTVEPSAEGEAAWVETVIGAAIQRQKFAEECTPGYYNNEGNPSPLAARNSPYGKGPVAFAKLLAAWREDGKLEGLELSRN